MPQTIDVCVIGGGPAGMIAAISATNANVKVTLLEKNDRVGKKLLTTGNGRCNLSNLDLSLDHYHGRAKGFAKKALENFNLEKTLSFFDQLGLPVIPDEDGKIFPRSQQAASVLDALRLEMEDLGVEVLTKSTVSLIKKEKNGFQITLQDNTILTAKTVILASGGMAVPATGSDGRSFSIVEALGHSVVPPLPALVQLKLGGTSYRAMEGMKWEAVLSLLVDGKKVTESEGDILFTGYGISGLAVLNLSREAAQAFSKRHPVEISIDLLPGESIDETAGIILARTQNKPGRTLEHFFTGWINKRIGQTVIRNLGYSLTAPYRSLGNQDIAKIAAALHDFRFTVAGDNGWANAQVTAGGVSTAEVNPESMESLAIPGLFFAGEILDIDGDSGGYNLQWAWSSGYTAGASAAKLATTR